MPEVVCLWVPVHMRLCVSVGAHIYPYLHIRTHTRIHTPVQEAAVLIFSQTSPKTFSKTFAKTLDKMADLCYDTLVIRDGDNLDDHSCTSCVLEDGDLAIGVPVFLSSKSLSQTLDIQDNP